MKKLLTDVAINSAVIAAIAAFVWWSGNLITSPRVHTSERAATSAAVDSATDAPGQPFVGVDSVEIGGSGIKAFSGAATGAASDRGESTGAPDIIPPKYSKSYPLAPLSAPQGVVLPASAAGDWPTTGAGGSHFRDYPTLTLDPVSSAPLPGYSRWRTNWSALAIDSVSYSKYRKPQYMTHHICTIPGGSATRDYPSSPSPVQMLVFLGGPPCRTNRHEIWSVYRGIEDWTCWIGCTMYRPGQPRTLSLFPPHGETIVVRRTHP